MIGVLSYGIQRIPYLEEFLGEPWVPLSFLHAPRCEKVVGWGLRKAADRARAYACSRGLTYLTLEDGFLRSVGLGIHEPPLSIVVDDLGIYYDATSSSRLESLIKIERPDCEEQRANTLMRLWRESQVSKYNHVRKISQGLPEQFVLVVDQTYGDVSIRYGQANEASFTRMLNAALDQHPYCTVLLKVHPDVFAGKKKGYFDRLTLGEASRVQVLAQDVHPAGLIEHAEAVYVVTSQMGFEGLLRGKPVHTFGMPFYAGWGLTRDALSAPKRRKPVQLESLVHSALVDYPRYIDPETGQRCEVERVLDHLALQRRMRERFPSEIYAPEFSRWKKPIVRAFFQGSGVKFVQRIDQAPHEAMLAVWGRRKRAYPHLDSIPESKGSVVRLEDGFLRSVGLGAYLVQPLSWVIDRRGIYYDATQPSDLEHILQNTEFDASLLLRARILRERLVTSGLTKYNVGTTCWQRPQARFQSVPPSAEEGMTPATQRVILVPGQVESDASLAYGAPGICKNVDLLRAVRGANPDAYLIYKPHPDVVAGLRRQGQDENDAARWCDEVVVDVSMGELLSQIDEVHTLTSLTGFEALLRGKRVVCYGQPFYAGWGLTLDISIPVRRTRKLSLDALVAGVLILYPTYVSRTTGKFTTPERALDELLAWRANDALTLPWWSKGWRWIFGLGSLCVSGSYPTNNKRKEGKSAFPRSLTL